MGPYPPFQNPWDWTKKDILMVEKLDRIIVQKVWEQNEILRATGVGGGV